MGLELSQQGQILYDGKVVGRVTHDPDTGDAGIVLNLDFKCDPGDQVVPLTYLSIGLNKLAKPRQPALLTVQTTTSDLLEEEGEQRLLLEEIVKLKGHVWVFHKADKDPWPSQLHGHDYDNNMKLDAINGVVYDATSRKRLTRLKPKKLQEVQDQLRSSKDFAALPASLL